MIWICFLILVGMICGAIASTAAHRATIRGLRRKQEQDLATIAAAVAQAIRSVDNLVHEFSQARISARTFVEEAGNLRRLLCELMPFRRIEHERASGLLDPAPAPPAVEAAEESEPSAFDDEGRFKGIEAILREIEGEPLNVNGESQ